MMELFADCVQGSTEGCCDTWLCAWHELVLVFGIPISLLGAVLFWTLKKGHWDNQFSIREKEERK